MLKLSVVEAATMKQFAVEGDKDHDNILELEVNNLKKKLAHSQSLLEDEVLRNNNREQVMFLISKDMEIMNLKINEFKNKVSEKDLEILELRSALIQMQDDGLNFSNLLNQEHLAISESKLSAESKLNELNNISEQLENLKSEHSKMQEAHDTLLSECSQYSSLNIQLKVSI